MRNWTKGFTINKIKLVTVTYSYLHEFKIISKFFHLKITKIKINWNESNCYSQRDFITDVLTNANIQINLEEIIFELQFIRYLDHLINNWGGDYSNFLRQFTQENRIFIDFCVFKLDKWCNLLIWSKYFGKNKILIIYMRSALLC